MAIQDGQTIGAYRIVRQLGAGGMGAVYEAVHVEIGKRAAVKVLHPHLAQNPEIAARFLNEARATSLIEHAGMVAVFEFGRLPDQTTYLVMEYLRGESLRQRLTRVNRLPVPEAARLCRQVAAALTAAHQHGVVHRDLKPDNVMIVPDAEAAAGERAKVLDFGIAKVAEAGSVKTQTGAMLGTPSYMAPEQFSGAGQAGPKADVYALGVMLFEVCAGRLPFLGQSLGALVVEHMQTAPPVLSTVAPGLPAELDGLLQAMLAKDPAGRPSMSECVSALERLAQGFMPATGPGWALTPAGGPGLATGPGPATPQPLLTGPAAPQPLAPLSTLGQAAGQRPQERTTPPAAPRGAALREWAPGLVVLTVLCGFWLLRHRDEGPAPKVMSVSGQTASGARPAGPAEVPAWQQAIDKARRAAEQASQQAQRMPTLAPLPALRLCLNTCVERIHDSQERYLSWVDAQQGPTGKERHVYGLYRISDGCGYCEQQLRDRDLPGALGGKDGAAAAFLASLATLTPISDEAERYYERKAHEDDQFARGQKLHKPLLAAFAAASAAGLALRRGADALEDEAQKEGGPSLASLAKELLRAGNVDLADLDVARLGEAQQAFERALDGATPKDSFQRSGAEGLATAGRELLRRLRDRKGVDGIHKSWVGTSSGWMVNGTPDQLINRYNSYAGHADLLPACRHYRSQRR